MNDYGQTDNVCNLFDAIDKAYLDMNDNVFSKMNEGDYVLAFFPCTRFETQISLWFRGCAAQQKNYSDLQKLNNDLYLHKQLHENYERITKLAIICIRKNLKLIIENPYGDHYLTRYWGVKPKVIDKNRRENGDYFEKPTQFWFINCEPKNNLVFEPITMVDKRTVNELRGDQVARSELHPQYAERFIKQYIAVQNEDMTFSLESEE